MKTLILALALLTASSVGATSYCYDSAVFSVYNFQEDVEACNSGVSTKNFDKLNKKLIKTIFFYGRIVSKQQNKLFNELKTSNRNHMSPAESECLDEAILKHEEKVRSKVKTAIQVCSL